MRRTFLFVVFLATLSASAIAEPNTQDIASAALAYRQSLSAPTNSSVASLLATIEKAENEHDLPQVVRLYENLAALQPDSFRSWLKLGLAWKEVDGKADGGVGAAWNSYRSAHSVSDQVEALLLLASFLRNQLAAASESYESARSEFATIDVTLRDKDNQPLACPAPSIASAHPQTPSF
jgi:hypothetical protein